MASNGLDLNAENTNVNVIEDDIATNSSKDAWTTFFNAKNQSSQYQTDAANLNKQATNATVSGVLNTASTALNGYSGASKNAFNGTTTTQSSSHISSNSLTMDTSRLKQSQVGWA